MKRNSVNVTEYSKNTVLEIAILPFIAILDGQVKKHLQGKSQDDGWSPGSDCFFNSYSNSL